MTRRLAKQADLTQRAQDAAILSNATNHAVECRDALEELSELVRGARLAETVPVSNKLNGLIRTAPEPLPRANIFVEIKVCMFQFTSFLNWYLCCVRIDFVCCVILLKSN